MTDQEKQLIDELARRIQNAPAPQVDRDADELIRRTIGSRPDALYILTQTVLIQEMALNQAKAQIDQLKQQAPPSNTSFLRDTPPPLPERGRSFGGEARTSQPAGNPGGYQGSSYQRGSYPPPPPQPLPPPPQNTPDPVPQSGGRFSGFLQNAAQTAAGVVAGEVAFSALSSIFGHHGGYYGGGPGFFGGGSGVSPVSETIINNYYDDDRGRGSNLGGDRGLDSGLSPDLEDRRFASDQQDNSQQDDDQQDDADVSDDSTDDSSDDSSFDDSSYDDGSGSNDL